MTGAERLIPNNNAHHHATNTIIILIMSLPREICQNLSLASFGRGPMNPRNLITRSLFFCRERARGAAEKERDHKDLRAGLARVLDQDVGPHGEAHRQERAGWVLPVGASRVWNQPVRR